MATYGISTYGTSIGVSASEIKNLALFQLGEPDEIDFSDETQPIVQKVNRIYETTLLYVLSNYPWRFIMKREELTNRTDADNTYKYRYNYVLPATMLSMRKIYYDEYYNSPIREFESNPRILNTDAQRVFLWYSAVVDETDFPQYFVDYFKYKLALDLCFNLTGDTDLIQLLAQQEQRMLISAKNIDAKQVQTRTVKSSPFVNIRH